MTHLLLALTGLIGLVVLFIAWIVFITRPTSETIRRCNCRPCEVCGAPADNYCTSCGSEQLANTE